MGISNGVNRKNLPLILALAIPVLMIVGIALSIYLPGVGKAPKYNFVYATGSVPYGRIQYVVRSGQLEKIENPNYYPPGSPKPAVPPGESANFYLYNTQTNAASSLTFEQAQKFRLDPSSVSADGYTIERGNGGGDFLFGGATRDYNSWFIKGHNRARRLNLKLDSQPEYYNNFQFLGWVE